jgi:hypothetical protein
MASAQTGEASDDTTVNIRVDFVATGESVFAGDVRVWQGGDATEAVAVGTAHRDVHGQVRQALDANLMKKPA